MHSHSDFQFKKCMVTNLQHDGADVFHALGDGVWGARDGHSSLSGVWQ